MIMNSSKDRKFCVRTIISH